MTDRTLALSNLLIALAMLQKNQRTHVNHEIRQTLELIKKEFEI